MENCSQKKQCNASTPSNSLFKSKHFPGLIQIIGLIAFFALAFFGFTGTTEAYRFTNITSFWVWCIWWPALVITGFISSRIWCTICPLRYITQKVGHLGWQVKVPASIRKNKLFVIIGFFALHTVIVSYGVHHFSWFTSVYLLSLLGIAFLIGLIFEKDSFCNSFCPLSGFIGAYSKLGTAGLRCSDKDVCKSCRTKACFRACPAGICMGAPKEMENCLLCFDCVKECPNDNISFSFHKPLRALWKSAGTVAHVFIVVLLLGIMFEEFGEEWVVVEHFVNYIPDYLISIGMPETIFGYKWLTAGWVTFLFPALIVFGTAAASFLLAKRDSVMHYAKAYSPALIPLIFTLHLSKMIDTLNTKLGYGKYVLQNPVGNKTIELIANGNIAVSSNALFSTQTEGYVLMGLILTGFVSSLFAIFKIAQKQKTSSAGKASALPFYFTTITLGLTSLFITANWFNISLPVNIFSGMSTGGLMATAFGIVLSASLLLIKFTGNHPQPVILKKNK